MHARMRLPPQRQHSYPRLVPDNRNLGLEFLHQWNPIIASSPHNHERASFPPIPRSRSVMRIDLLFFRLFFPRKHHNVRLDGFLSVGVTLRCV